MEADYIMKRYSRILALLLASSMLMAGCGKNDNKEAESSIVEETTESETEENKEEDSKKEEALAEEPADEENSEEESEEAIEETIDLDKEEPFEYEMPSPVCLVKTTVTYQDGKDIKGEKDTIRIAPTPDISFGLGADTLTDLSDSVDMIMKLQDVAFENAYDEAKEMAIDAPSSDFLPYVCTSKISVPRADNFVMSLVIESYQATGGAHGNTAVTTHCLDSQTGNELKLSDIVRNTDKLPEMIMSAIDKNVNLMVDKNYFEEAVKKNELSFVLDNTGMTFYFSPYDIAPYSDGIVTASIPFFENEYFFVKKYSDFTTGPNYAAHLVAGLPYSDYTIDGRNLIPITVYSVEKSNGGPINEIIIDADKEHCSLEIDDAAFVEYTYFQYVDCGSCIYAEATGVDGAMTTYVFAVDSANKTIEYVDRLDNMCAPMYGEEIDGEAYFNLLAHPEGMIMERAGRVDRYAIGSDYKPFLPSAGDD